jgi:hypothetical protein
MSERHDLPQIVKEALQESVQRQHLSDGALVRYHDETLDAASREVVTLHLERCAACRARLSAVTKIHLSEDDFIDYHDGQIRNPHTLARVRAHLEAQHCQSCQTWLAEFRQAEAMAAQWVATHQPVHTETPQRATVRQSLETAMQRLQETLITLICGSARPALVPQHATLPQPVRDVSSDGLAVSVQDVSEGGQCITLSSDHAEYAGRLIEFIYTVPDAQEQLFRGFSVLPMTPTAFCVESMVHVPQETMASWPMPVQLTIRCRDSEQLTQDDIAALDWSVHHVRADDDISREAWRAFCQRHQESRVLPQAVRAWCVSQVSEPS